MFKSLAREIKHFFLPNSRLVYFERLNPECGPERLRGIVSCFLRSIRCQYFFQQWGWLCTLVRVGYGWRTPECVGRWRPTYFQRDSSCHFRGHPHVSPLVTTRSKAVECPHQKDPQVCLRTSPQSEQYPGHWTEMWLTYPTSVFKWVVLGDAGPPPPEWPYGSCVKRPWH